MLTYKYKDKGTVIHRLSPWSKLGWTASLVLQALIFNHPVYLFLLFLSTIPVVLVAKLSKEWLALMKFSFFLCALIVAVNALVSQQGSHVLLQAPFSAPVIGNPRVTLEGLGWGLGNSLRLLVIISAFTLLMFAIHPDDLMLALAKLRLPYKSLLISSLSAKFVPILVEDAKLIADVQRSRGLELDKGGRLRKTKAYMAIGIPLLSNSLERAAGLAEAMESRGFGSGKRTFYREQKLTRLEVLALIASLLPGGFGLALHFLGFGGYRYYPVLQQVGFAGEEVILLPVWLLLLNSMLLVALGGNALD